MLVLASSSVYRRELLARLRIPFSIFSPDVDEAALTGEPPRETALRLAGMKARTAARAHPDGLIVGSDQVAVLGGQALGKPGYYEAALRQLTAMAGRVVTFHTAVCLFDARTGVCQIDEVPTRVWFRHYSLGQAQRYLEAEPAYDCAGSAKIESLGIALVERVESSDPTALIGLPLIALTTMFINAGIDLP
jgi:septum formation protein